MARKKTQAQTEEFRRKAVKRASLKGITNAADAKELGISVQQIYNWRRQFSRLSDKQFNSLEGAYCAAVGNKTLSTKGGDALTR